ncbi:MAG: hypothetical protein GX045_03140 [Clostridiaceae bacterium]|jgi:hypothetical protein|nr:hypothetical protein [Clostridiaceae bacterium]
MYHHLVLNHFGVQVKYPTLETLDKSLSGGYRNIVLMVFVIYGDMVIADVVNGLYVTYYG